MRRLSYNSRRVFVGIAMVPVLLCLLNYYAEMNWFGKYGGEALAASFVFLFVAIVYIGPTIREMEERRAMNKNQRLE